MTITLHKWYLVLIGASLALGAVAMAVAAWSTTGSGDANARAATVAQLTVGDASGTVSGDLYPGGTGALKLKLSNPNAFPLQITAVSLQSGGSIASSSSACNSGGHAVTFTNQSGLSVTLAAGATDEVVTLAGSVAMGSAAANACQGATFTIPVDVVATST